MAHHSQCDEEHEATLQRVFSSEGLNLGNVAPEQFQQSGGCRQEYQFCLEITLQEGLMTGATDVSKPVGSGRVFMHFSSKL